MERDTAANIAFFFLIIGSVGFIFMIGYACGLGVQETKAIEAGVAEWRIDPKTGDKSFHFITPTKIEKDTK